MADSHISQTAARDIFEDPDEIEFRYRVGRLQLTPGDVLVVKVDHPISPEAAARIRQYVDDATPSGTRTIVIDASIDLSVLTKTEIDERVNTGQGVKS